MKAFWEWLHISGAKVVTIGMQVCVRACVAAAADCIASQLMHCFTAREGALGVHISGAMVATSSLQVS